MWWIRIDFKNKNRTVYSNIYYIFLNIKAFKRGKNEVETYVINESNLK